MFWIKAVPALLSLLFSLIFLWHLLVYEERGRSLLFWGALAGLFLMLFILSLGVVFIAPNQAGVVVSPRYPGGILSEPLAPGLHLLFPLVDRVHKYPLSSHTLSMSGDDAIDARSLDGQRVYVDVSVIYRLKMERVIDIHKQWQDRYATDLMMPIIRGAVRDVVSMYQAEEIASTKREEVAQKIEERLSSQLQAQGVEVVESILRDVGFTPEYTAAIEQKQIAEQQALKARLEVEQKKYEAEQMRQTAQGEADALVIRAKANAEARLISAQAEADAIRLVGEALSVYPQATAYLLAEKSEGVKYVIVTGQSPLLVPVMEK